MGVRLVLWQAYRSILAPYKIAIVLCSLSANTRRKKRYLHCHEDNYPWREDEDKVKLKKQRKLGERAWFVLFPFRKNPDYSGNLNTRNGTEEGQFPSGGHLCPETDVSHINFPRFFWKIVCNLLMNVTARSRDCDCDCVRQITLIGIWLRR